MLLLCGYFSAVVLGFLEGSYRADGSGAVMPSVYANGCRGEAGGAKAVGEADLFSFERSLREEFARKDAPDEMFAIAKLTASDLILAPPRAVQADRLLRIAVFGKQADLRCFGDDATDRYFHRRLSQDEIASLHDFITTNKVDDLPSLQNRFVHGTAYVYLHFNTQRGVRVTIFNPPLPEERKDLARDDPLWRYSNVIEFSRQIADADKLTVRYSMATVPGMEVIYAHPENEIRAVWKNGTRLCVAVGRLDDIREEFRVLSGGRLKETVSDPKFFEDQIAAMGEVPVISGCSSPDGRWSAGVTRSDGRLVCYDNRDKRFINIADEDVRAKYIPMHYIQFHRAFLVARFLVRPLNRDVPISAQRFRLLDPATGTDTGFPSEELNRALSSPSSQEPWFQRLPRCLQAVKESKGGIIWAAFSQGLYDGTSVGAYDLRTFRWLRSQYIPHFRLETRNIFVDEDESKIYGVYKGHLLRFPMRKKTEKENVIGSEGDRSGIGKIGSE